MRVKSVKLYLNLNLQDYTCANLTTKLFMIYNEKQIVHLKNVEAATP